MTPQGAALAGLVLVASATGAQAATLTFDTPFNGPSYAEAGLTVTALPGSDDVNVTGGGALGFDTLQDPSGFSIAWELTADGPFDLLSILLVHVDVLDPVTFEGFAGGSLVATRTFGGSFDDPLLDPDDPNAESINGKGVAFSGFTGLDRVVISLGSVFYGDPRFDDLSFGPSEVPLPAALPLLGAALGGLALVRRRRA